MHSLSELQFYAFTPRSSQEGTEGVPNHCLIMRKNLNTERFEVARLFAIPIKRHRHGWLFHTNIQTGAHEVAFEGNFADALKFGDAEYYRAFGHKLENIVCEHEWPSQAFPCQVAEWSKMGSHGTDRR